jgi:hypothetical protein
MWKVYSEVMHVANQLSMWEWFAVLLTVVVLGWLFCLRGFGGRLER